MRPLLAVLLAATAILVAAVSAVAAGNPLPVTYSSAAALPTFVNNHDGPPPGADDFACKPGSQHPRPVVLVPGTTETMAFNFNALSPLLKNAGYCVFALNYGRYHGLDGVGEISASAGQLSDFVDRVRQATGAAKVDIVGHSQGGMMPRYYLRFLGGADKVDHLVGLAPSNHGSTVDDGSVLLMAFPWLHKPADVLAGPAWTEQAAGSAFLTRLNQGGDTLPGIRYTVIETEYDQVVTPYDSAFLRGGGDVTNTLLQDQCPKDLSEHVAIAFDHIALQDVLNALDPAHAVPPKCSPVFPYVGG